MVKAEVRRSITRSEVFTPIDAQNVETAYTSDSVSTWGYRYFVLYLDIDSTESPTDIVIEVQFSPDNTNWYKFMNDFFGDMRWTDTETADGVAECVCYNNVGRYMRLVATVTGGDGSNFFAVTARVELYN